ncbi:hypothetical protein EDB86DRAFT_1899916 [Lactarius hatsudake]|nr:hypothetical protein EDB86DRAFT_1899916 [Lactarius hatsudake]
MMKMLALSMSLQGQCDSEISDNITGISIRLAVAQEVPQHIPPDRRHFSPISNQQWSAARAHCYSSEGTSTIYWSWMSSHCHSSSTTPLTPLFGPHQPHHLCLTVHKPMPLPPPFTAPSQCARLKSSPYCLHLAVRKPMATVSTLHHAGESTTLSLRATPITMPPAAISP